MSYILDALKKSESERQRARPAPRSGALDIVAPTPRAKSIWPTLLIAALVCNGLVLAFLLRSPRVPPPFADQSANPQAGSEANSPAPSGVVPGVASGVGPGVASGVGPGVAKEGSAAPSAQPRYEGVPELSELPPGVRQDLPPLALSLHSYVANAAERKVGVNGRVLHEGDEVGGGLVLEQVTETGAIFTFHGYRFLVRLF